ncbi:MAG: SRPBCC family protein [Cyanobacteria bacterium SZAS LIN-2]|nr:SRPBCC family protein [Cyanobacteria bacterium SZAS LIN-3]MBS1996347.1 SRPBCC family protein [Cyanobacteria bacterium SZAS LIN-2]
MIQLALLAVGGVLGVAAFRPKTFRVERKVAVNASPEKIFPMINDFKRWAEWSPFENIDPTMTKTFSGAESGKGAKYAWEGKGKAGAGSMEIVETTEPNQILINLSFTKPFACTNLAEFTIEPDGESTVVTWAMSGSSPYIARVIGIFCPMDKMVGGDFEKGLSTLKSVAEA